MPADAYLRGHSAAELRAVIARRPRRARLRDGPCADLRAATPAPTAPSARRPSADGLDGRERAQAQRLAYGAVQRRGTSDAAIERLADRSPRLLDPPVLAALRLGLYELLFADATPDHAAVDQAVELVKGAGARRTRRGFVNAVLRRAAREREELLRRCSATTRRPRPPRRRHSAPLWLARDVVAGAGRRRRPARCSPPATSRPSARCGSNTLRADRERDPGATLAGGRRRAPSAAAAPPPLRRRSRSSSRGRSASASPRWSQPAS